VRTSSPQELARADAPRFFEARLNIVRCVSSCRSMPGSHLANQPIARRGRALLGLVTVALLLAPIGCGGGAGSGDAGGSAGGRGPLNDAGSVGGSGGVGAGTSGAGGNSAGASVGGGDQNDGGFSDVRPPGPLSKRQACRDYLAAACRRELECGIIQTFESCFDGLAAKCPDYLFSPDSTRTIDSVESCAPIIGALSCADIASGNYPTCATGGTRKEGAACAFHAQCESLTCVNTTLGAGACGTCAHVVAAGDSCSGNVACPRGTGCQGGKCVVPSPTLHPDPVGKDQTCGQGPCEAPLLCVATLGGGSGICKDAPATGQPCADGIYFPRSSPALQDGCSDIEYCDFSYHCAPIPGPGEACGDPGAAFALICAQGSYCDIAASDASTFRRCKRGEAVGGSCSDKITCAIGLVCVRPDGGATGTCERFAEEGEACGAPYVECAIGTRCSSGTCVALDSQGLAVGCGVDGG
jgi:hypothetical protein